MTLSVDNENAHIEIYIDFDSFAVQNQVTIVRVHPDGAEFLVRGGYRIVTFGPSFNYFLIDTEAPLDTAVTYRAFEDVTGLDPSTTVVTGGPATIDSGGYQWFKDPSRPWANIRVDLCPQSMPCTGTDDVSLLGLGDKTRSADANLVPVLDRKLPADVWARRKGITSSVSFLTRSLTAVSVVETLFAAGGPLFLQIQPEFGWPDAYWQPDDLTEAYTGSRDQRVPFRRWAAPLTQIDQPSPVSAAQGVVCATWCAIEAAYPTIQDLTDTGQSWLGVANCSAVSSPFTGYGFGPYGSGPYGG